MNLRTTLFLLLLNALVALGLVLTHDTGPVGGRFKLLPEGVNLAEADGIDFSTGSGCPAFALRKGSEGRWRLDGPDGPLANQVATAALLSDLARAPVLPFETESSVDHGLAPPGRSVTISAAGRPLVTVEIGKAHPLNIGTFVRVKGEEAARLTINDLAAWRDRRPGHYRELRVFPFSPLEIRRLEVVRELKGGESQRIVAERKWLTWFLRSPRRLRGDSRAFEGMVSGLLGVRRSGTKPVPDRGPVVRVKVVTEAYAVELEVWVFGDSEWLGRVAGEDDAIPLERMAILPLLAPFGQMWDRALFHDSARRTTAVEWTLGGKESVILEQDPTRPDGWAMRSPRKVAADTEACRAFLQKVVRLEADGLCAAGTTDAGAGLEPPWGRIRLTFVGGVGSCELLVGEPLSDGHRVRFRRDSENIFRITEKKLRTLPRSALALVDRTIYRGFWQQVSRVEIQRTGRAKTQRFLFENVGQVEQRHWRCTDVTGRRPARAESYVAGTPMRSLLVHVTEKLRADAVLAWSKAEASAEDGAAWGLDRPRYVLAFQDTAGRGNREMRIAVGRPQEDRNGETWYPVWLEGAALSARPFVYRIDRDLVRRIRAVMPD